MSSVKIIFRLSVCHCGLLFVFCVTSFEDECQLKEKLKSNMKRGEGVTDVKLNIFIYCNWVSTRWWWSVDLYKTRREKAQTAKQYKNTEYPK